MLWMPRVRGGQWGGTHGPSRVGARLVPRDVHHRLVRLQQHRPIENILRPPTTAALGLEGQPVAGGEALEGVLRVRRLVVPHLAAVSPDRKISSAAAVTIVDRRISQESVAMH
eukprot:COSAG04_NODE_23401_length_339_cov_0.745833_1_plen_112_part_11